MLVPRCPNKRERARARPRLAEPYREAAAPRRLLICWPSASETGRKGGGGEGERGRSHLDNTGRRPNKGTSCVELEWTRNPSAGDGASRTWRFPSHFAQSTKVEMATPEGCRLNTHPGKSRTRNLRILAGPCVLSTAALLGSESKVCLYESGGSTGTGRG